MSTIQWFPGHMAKAIRELKAKKNEIDILIEILDARIPLASRNPVIQEIFESKPRLIILTKSDLADAKITKSWIDRFTKEDQLAFAIDGLNGHHGRKISSLCKRLFPDKKVIKGLIVGIPNVGKSTLINNLLGKNKVKTGYHPGVTKRQDWISLEKGLRVCDTPGILWPKFEDPKVGQLLAVTHAIKDERFDFTNIIYFLFEYLQEHYPHYVEKRFKLDDISQLDVEEMLVEIGRKRGCIVSGGEIDDERLFNLLMHEFRRGLIGHISLEKPA